MPRTKGGVNNNECIHIKNTKTLLKSTIDHHTEQCKKMPNAPYCIEDKPNFMGLLEYKTRRCTEDYPSLSRKAPKKKT